LRQNRRKVREICGRILEKPGNLQPLGKFRNFVTKIRNLREACNEIQEKPREFVAKSWESQGITTKFKKICNETSWKSQ